MKQAKIIILIIIIAVISGLFIWRFTKQASAPSPTQQACTLEAKLCDDGSSVGRTGPNCEFALCTTKENKIADETVDWRTYRNDEIGIEFKYPADWNKGGDEKNTPSWLNSPEEIYKKSTTKTYPNVNFSLDALITIETLNNPSNLTLQEMFNNGHKKCLASEAKDPGMGCPGAYDTSSWQKIIVDGKSALRSGKIDVPEGLPSDFVYIKLSTKFLIISATYYNNEYSELNSVFNNILSTFKFTK